MAQPFRQDPRPPGIRKQWAGTMQVPIGLEPERVDPSQPGGFAGADKGRFVRLPGANFAPAGSVPVDVLGDASIAPGANAVLVTVPIPDTQRFHMAGIGFGAGDEAALGFLTWSINQNGDAITPGYGNVQSVIGEINFLAEIAVTLGSSILVTVVGRADPAAVLTYQYFCRLRGWFYIDQEAGQ